MTPRLRIGMASAAVLAMLTLVAAECVPPDDSGRPRPSTTTAAPSTTVAPSTTTTVAPTTTAATTTTTPVPGSGDYFADFEDPAQFAADFQVDTVHCCDSPPSPATFHGDHDLSCGSPYTVRTINASDPSTQTWWCAPGGVGTGHVMTGENTTAKGVVAFSPKRSFTAIRKVCWDQNLTELGGRKWTTLFVVPETVYQANGGRLVYGDNNLETAAPFLTPSSSVFHAVFLRGSVQGFMGLTTKSSPDFGLGEHTTLDKAARFQVCVTDNENGSITVTEQVPGGGTDTATLSGVSLPNVASRVILQDVAYDPDKDDVSARPADPYTVHWDNVTVDVA